LIQRIADEQAASAKRQLDQAAREAKAAGVECAGEAVDGDPVNILTAAAATADLLVIGQPGGDNPGGLDLSVAGDVVTSSPCPVLCVPYAGQFAVVGGNVLLAWNGGKEAARAMRAALPLLARAKKATVLGIGDPPAGRANAAAAADFLKRHGVAAESRTIPPGDIDPGSILLGLVTDMGIDLIVMGAYGHSRAREFIFGGVTRSLLQQMTAPVLFAH
jgi:nucleotide-binding universal stress UspA family protein